jgi:hypothetical protein
MEEARLVALGWVGEMEEARLVALGWVGEIDAWGGTFGRSG